MSASLHSYELACYLSAIKIRSYLSVANLAHAAAERISNQQAFVHDCLALEILVAGKSDRFAHALARDRRYLHLPGALSRRTNHRVRLVAKICSKPTVSGHNLTRSQQLFAISRGMRGDFRCFFAALPQLFEVFTDLLAAWAGSVKVLLSVSLDLWCTAASALDFVPELSQAIGQFRLVDRGGCPTENSPCHCFTSRSVNQVGNCTSEHTAAMVGSRFHRHCLGRCYEYGNGWFGAEQLFSRWLQDGH